VFGRRLPLVVGAALVALALAAPAATAHGSTDRLGAGHAFLVNYQRTHGYLPIGNDFAAYERNVTARYQRWQHQHGVAPAAPAAPTGMQDPVATVNVEGQKDDRLAPPDPTGAAGPSSYIQFINDDLGIYTRSGTLIKSVGTAAFAAPGGSDTDYSDPQILFDPRTQRFYYLIIHTTDDTFAWGFSKNNNPQNPATDFCDYTADFGYGPDLPDYPKLGQSRDFLLIGANIYAVEAYVGSDIDWITKPPSAHPFSTCPAPSKFKQGQDVAILNADGATFASDPNPAQQMDPSGTGWVVAVPDETNSGATGNFLTIFPVTKNPDGTANIPNVGTQVDVSTFAPPPPSAQNGSNYPIDTLDGRLTHAVSANDPAHGNAVAVWTGHTIQGGAGAEYRWYEIDVANATLFQSGDITDPNLFVFNGGIAPDRLVKSKTVRKFGSNAVIGFTTSSVTTFPAAEMVSKIGSNPVSAFVMVKLSVGPDNGFDCVELQRCRWGDYAGAVSDPGANPNAATGQVWLTNMISNGTSIPNPLAPTWSTEIWAATP